MLGWFFSKLDSLTKLNFKTDLSIKCILQLQVSFFSFIIHWNNKQKKSWSLITREHCEHTLCHWRSRKLFFLPQILSCKKLKIYFTRFKEYSVFSVRTRWLSTLNWFLFFSGRKCCYTRKLWMKKLVVRFYCCVCWKH